MTYTIGNMSRLRHLDLLAIYLAPTARVLGTAHVSVERAAAVLSRDELMAGILDDQEGLPLVSRVLREERCKDRTEALIAELVHEGYAA